ncbi:hypothetical protein ACEWY4_006329 [Coilia grayii]|uniref:Uncharacterized protein n=1 Tax=Coilia grayii TaxID=363190 RepID=A0ABD1KD96_9TELE
MDEINAVCVPMFVHLEDATCLIGSISDLSERISFLHLSPNMGYEAMVSTCSSTGSKQRGAVKQTGHFISMLAERQEGHQRLGLQQGSSRGQSRRGTMTEKRKGGTPNLVELYQFPGFSTESVTPLPNHTSFATVVAHVVRAQHRLDHKDFPSILSQTLYSCFCCCFPQSCSTMRNSSFLQTLCSTAYQWTGGVSPGPNACKKWDFEALEPDEAKTLEYTTENEKKETGVLTADAVTYRQLVRQCRERSAVCWREMKASMARCEQDLADLQRSKDEFDRIILRKQKRILSEPCSVKQFCQQLHPDLYTTTEEKTEMLSENSKPQ